MSTLHRNIIAVIIGLIACMAVNGILIGISSSFIPLPEGVHPNDGKSIADNNHRYEVKHFVFPFLAHGLGSVIGAFLTALIAGSRKMTFALVIGGVHLLGGVAMVIMVGGPVWFIALDLGVAYLPAAWIGGKLASRGGRTLKHPGTAHKF